MSNNAEFAAVHGTADGPRFGTVPELRPLAAQWQAVEDAKLLESLRSISATDLGTWIDRLHRAGVAADRHNSPDLLGQLNQALRRPVDTVLCGVLDVDPAACLNSALAARFPIELAAGVLVVGQITQAGRVSIITDSRVPWSWFAMLRRACSQAKIRIEPIVNDYPQADPTLLLYSLLGRRLRPGRLPSESGVVLFDAAAAVAIGRSALVGEPMSQSPLLVRDHALRRSHFVTAPHGMLLVDLLQRLELPWQDRVIRGGDLLRDVRLPPRALVGSGELVLHTAPPLPAIIPNPCIRCGWCVESCPTRVQPAAALEASQRNDIDMAEDAGIEACIECGICSYVCPSRLPLLEGILRMKRMEKTALQA